MAALSYEALYTFADAVTGIDYLAEAQLRLASEHALHAHVQLQVLWVIEGQMRMVIDKRWHDLRPGTMCRIEAGRLHAVGPAERARRARILDLRLAVGTGNAMERFVAALPDGPLFDTDARHVASAAGAIRQAVSRRSTNPAAVQALIWQLMADLHASRPQVDAPARKDRRLELAESFMLARLAHPISVRHIAQAVQLSPSQLTRLYAAMGTTPADRLRDLRVMHARRLLRETTLSIKQAAHACGFVCPNHFSRVYYERTGVRPSSDRG